MRRRALLALVTTAALWLAAAPAVAGLPGDVDADCDVDVADAVLLERSLAGFVSLTDEQADNADLVPIGGGSSDGAIDVGDLVTLQRLVAGDEDPVTPLAQPVISTVTGANPVQVSGTAVAGATVTLYVNGVELPHTVTADAVTGAFDFTGFRQVPLVDGPNRITVVAESGGLESCSSAPEDKTFAPPSPPLPNDPPPTVNGAGTTVWTPGTFGGLPVRIPLSHLKLLSGDALYIQPGVVLEFIGDRLSQEDRIYVSQGHLQIRGTAEEKVILRQDASVCDDDTRWGGITISLNAPGGVNNVIEHAVIDCVQSGVSVGGGTLTAKLIMRNSEVSNWASTAVSYGNTGSRGAVQDNVFAVGPGTIGLSTFAPLWIARNVIRATNLGIHLKGSGIPFSLVGNDVRGARNQGGGGILISIPGSSTFDIKENTLTDNCNGVVIERDAGSNAAPTLEHNNIFDNENCKLSCSTGAKCGNNYTTSLSGFPGCTNPPPALPATDNWWGTIDVNDISENLYGYCGDPAPIDFIPFLDAPFDEGGVSVGAANVIQGDIYDGMMGFPTGTEWLVLGTATVPTGMPFTVPDGTTVEFGADAQLIVQGTLTVEDSTAADVLFTAVPPPTGTPSAGHWDGIRIEGGGSAAIADAIIEYAGPAIEVVGAGSHLDLSGSIVRKFALAGIRIEGGADADIHDNRDAGGTLGIFAAAGKAGIVVEDDALDVGDVVLDNNEIRNAQAAVRITDASPQLYRNLVTNSTFGVYIADTGAGTTAPEITDGGVAGNGNEITGNCHGIYVYAPTSQPLPIVNENKIYDNDGCPAGGAGTSYNYNVADYGSGPENRLEAENNWWGGNPSVASAISATIRDRSEGASLPTVDFVPFYEDSTLSTLDTGTYLLGAVMSDSGDPGDMLGSGTYQVVGDLDVPSGEVWRIGPGAVLEFPQSYPSHQIDVAGALEVLGQSGSEVVFRPAAGASSWGGIRASGGDASLAIQHAQFSGTSRAIDVADTDELISISDSEFDDCTTAIFLDNVTPGGATIDGNDFADVFGALSAVDSVLQVDGNQIVDVAVGILVAGDSNAVIGSSPSTGNTIDDFSQTGILFTGVSDPAGSIAYNSIENTATPKVGTGILLDGSSPDVYQNLIRGADIGILVMGQSDPMIGEDSPASLPSNDIESNRIGIRIEGTPSAPSAQQPDPTIRKNDLSGNDEAAVEVVGFPSDTDFVIDAKENWWGDATPAGIRAEIVLDPSNPRPVEFTNYFTDAAMTTQAGTTPVEFTTVIERVTRTAPTFTPTLATDSTVGITVDTVGPATNIVLQIYQEDDDARSSSSLIYQDDETFSGSYTFVWDGKYNQGASAGEFVDDEAYVYVVSAPGSVGSYDPPRPDNPSRRAEPRSALMPDTYNVYRNDYMGIIFDVDIVPARVSLKMLTAPHASGGTPIRTLFSDVPFPQRDFQYFLYDGRDASGVLDPANAEASRYFFVPVPKDLHSNHVIVEHASPQIHPPDFDPTVPRLEVLSDPYLVVNSYDQVSTIVFQLDQAADVSVQIHDEAMTPVGAPLQIYDDMGSPVSNPLSGGQTYSVTWSGVEALNTNDEFDLRDETYTFAITATNADPAQTHLTTTYRGVIQVRQ